MKTNTLIELGLKLSQSHTAKEFQASIEQAVDFMGATRYGAMACATECDKKSDTEPMPTFVVHNMPQGYLDSFANREIGRIDTVMQHCRHSSLPIVWDESTYAKADQIDLWEDMAAHGLYRGACLGLHLERHRHFCFGVEWDRPAALLPEAQIEIAAALQILTVFAEPAAYRIQQADPPHYWDTSRPLSLREAECLHWVSRGMTDDLIARILDISPRTVRKHVESCILKLGAANRTEAAVNAVLLGLTQHSSQSNGTQR